MLTNTKYNKEKDYSIPIFPGIKYKKIEKEDLRAKIILAKKGDEDAYKDILCHMHNYLCFLTKEFFIQGSEPQDVYQEGMIKLINVIQKYDEKKGSFSSFAQSSIRKHIITSINKEQAKKRTVLNTSLSLNGETKNQDGEQISFIDTIKNEDMEFKVSASLDIVQKDYELYIIEEISKVLSDMEQKVFVLRFIDGLSYREIAIELGLKKRDSKSKKWSYDQKSVDNAIWRSRPKIKKAMERLHINHSKFNLDEKITRKRKSSTTKTKKTKTKINK